jgi:alpha-N-arabinofuranosidase
MKPGFIRMPGGNYLEGTGPRTRWDWTKSIGRKEARSGHFNTAVRAHKRLRCCSQPRLYCV